MQTSPLWGEETPWTAQAAPTNHRNAGCRRREERWSGRGSGQEAVSRGLEKALRTPGFQHRDTQVRLPTTEREGTHSCC